MNAAAFRGPRRKYFRWGKAMRPRKPDETLSRHGLGARRVVLLAPRGVLGKYRHPLGYVGAITKILGKIQKQVAHFGRSELYSEWGRSPGIRGPRKVPQRSEDTLWGFSEEGGSHSHVRGRQLIFYLRTRRSLWVSLSPVTNSIFGACLNTMKTPSECYLSSRLTDSEGAATKARGSQAAGFSSRT